jgi:predicted AAA+ superfamily ATPase
MNDGLQITPDGQLSKEVDYIELPEKTIAELQVFTKEQEERIREIVQEMLISEMRSLQVVR